MKPLLIVDGYNVIGAWKEAEAQQCSIDEARDKLTNLLLDYSGYSGEEVVLVFDGYRSERRTATEEKHATVTVVYTKHGETADSYIERLVVQSPKYRTIRVATSDGQIQTLALGAGATRITSRELIIQMQQLRKTSYAAHKRTQEMNRNPLGARLPREVQEALERFRRGE
ncbi:MAG: NYN domain-containing protein [Clostridiales bacterium]|nr:NYN domain-containing protein [Clostridiales bacterium]